jgi:ClpX C4-type zinc finger
MFIRWQSSRGQKSESSPDGIPDIGWTAILAERYSVDGDPRSRLIAYLGSITESSIKIDPQRCHFWDRVTRALDRLGDQVTDDDRAQIEAAIAVKVPRPSLAEYRDIARESARKLGWDFLTEAQQAALQGEAKELQRSEDTADESIHASTGKTSVGETSDIESLLCSFCGKSQEDAFALVSSGQAHICDECIETAAALVTARKENEAAPRK